MPGNTEELTNEDDVPVVTDLQGLDDLLVLRPGADPVTPRNPDGYGLVRAPYSIVQATAGVAGAAWYTLTDLLGAVIPSGVDVLVTSGFYEPGDGGDALLRRVGADPGHPAAWPDAAGEYFELVPWGGRSVNVLQMGAKVLTGALVEGEGFDSTAFVHAAFEYCAARSLVVQFPAGAVRVTEGYDNTTAYHDVMIEGSCFSSRRFSQGQVWQTSTVVLDNPDAGSYFLNCVGNNGSYVDRIGFACTQRVQDRKFFRFAQDSGQRQIFRDVSFKLVDKPITWEEGSYFQFSYFENIHFIDSGTFHSEALDSGGLEGERLLGTGLTLKNIGHDGTVPPATEKVVMNLKGIRHVQGDQGLIEGALPGPGWTGLRHSSASDDFWPSYAISSFRGFWMEFGGSQLDYMLDLDSGRFTIEDAQLVGLGFNGNNKIKLGTNTRLHLKHLPFDNVSDVETCFERVDNASHVFLEKLTTLGTRPLPTWITLEDCTRGGTSPQNVVVQSNSQGALVARWDGGFFDGTLISGAVQGGGTIHPSTDATFGRKLVVTPPGSTLRLSIGTKAERFVVRDPVVVVAKVKLPTFSAGSIIFSIGRSEIDWGSVAIGAASSGQVVDLRVAASVQDASTGGVTFYAYTSGGIADLAGEMEIYALEFYKGDDAPRSVHPSHPRNIRTSASAMPTAGAWTAGDFVHNSAPAISGGRVLLGWARLTTGSGHTSGTDWAPVYADSP